MTPEYKEAVEKARAHLRKRWNADENLRLNYGCPVAAVVGSAEYENAFTCYFDQRAEPEIWRAQHKRGPYAG